MGLISELGMVSFAVVSCASGLALLLCSRAADYVKPRCEMPGPLCAQQNVNLIHVYRFARAVLTMEGVTQQYYH